MKNPGNVLAIALQHMKQQMGEPVSMEELLTRFPHMEAEVREMLEHLSQYPPEVLAAMEKIGIEANPDPLYPLGLDITAVGDEMERRVYW